MTLVPNSQDSNLEVDLIYSHDEPRPGIRYIKVLADIHFLLQVSPSAHNQNFTWLSRRRQLLRPLHLKPSKYQQSRRLGAVIELLFHVPHFIVQRAPRTLKAEEENTPGPVVKAAGEPENFTCFPKLPPELRIKIWCYACSITRNADLWVKWLSYDDFNCSHNLPYYWYSSCAVPAILHANKESRAEGLKHYELSFATNQMVKSCRRIGVECKEYPMVVYTPARIYFTWENDRLCLLDPYRMDEGHRDSGDSKRFQDFEWKCAWKKPRYFAINTARDPDLAWKEGQEDDDLGFKRYLPRDVMLEEVVLFENHHWLLQWSGKCAITGLDFVDVQEGVDQRPDFVKKGLADHIQRSREEYSDEMSQVMPVIRTCTAIFQNSAKSI
ncbi:hypothetical protein N431DRAFT_515140 [Stipitochalara longipes BDJ]|nr:hypothetical protein N431DRAFT_515140 [Stipitochalara longipes BDJ]